MHVEQNQPQYETVAEEAVEQDAIYEEPPQVRHSLPELILNYDCSYSRSHL